MVTDTLETPIQGYTAYNDIVPILQPLPENLNLYWIYHYTACSTDTFILSG